MNNSSTTTKEALEPCPFCGTPATLQLHDDLKGMARIVCRAAKCKLWPSTPWYTSVEEVAALWNPRVSATGVAPDADADERAAWEKWRGQSAPASPVAPARSVQHLVNQWQAAWVSTQSISRDSETDLVRRIEAFAATTPPSTLAKAAAEEIAVLEKPNHTSEITAMDQCDICANYKSKITAIIERCLAGGGEDQKSTPTGL